MARTRDSADETALACYCRAAVSPGVARRALITAIIVGPILTAINQGDLLLAGNGFSVLKAGLTFLVPYAVATHGAASAILARERRDARGR